MVNQPTPSHFQLPTIPFVKTWWTTIIFSYMIVTQLTTHTQMKEKESKLSSLHMLWFAKFRPSHHFTDLGEHMAKWLADNLEKKVHSSGFLPRLKCLLLLHPCLTLVIPMFTEWKILTVIVWIDSKRSVITTSIFT